MSSRQRQFCLQKGQTQPFPGPTLWLRWTPQTYSLQDPLAVSPSLLPPLPESVSNSYSLYVIAYLALSCCRSFTAD